MDTRNIFSQLKKEESPSEAQKDIEVTVHTWNPMNSPETSVGHASLTIGEKHFGMWPRYSALVNPLTFIIPTPAHVETSLNEEIEREEGRKPENNIKFKVTAQQATAMKQQMTLISKDIEEDKALYELSPFLSIFKPISLISKGSRFISEDPFTQQPPNSNTFFKDKPNKAITSFANTAYAHNCVSSVAEILRAGNIPVPSTIYTPAALNDHVESLNADNNFKPK